MGTRKTNSHSRKRGGARPERRARQGGRRPSLSSLATIFLAAAILFSLVQCQCSGGRNATPSTTGTTVWPYGQPEYQIEVPEGYEGLLPAATQSPSEQKPSPGTAAAPDSSGGTKESDKSGGGRPEGQSGAANATGAAKGAESSKKPETIPKREKAEPYIVSAQRARESSGQKAQPTLIIVIDDVGYNLNELKPFLKLPFPITVAVLPQVDHTKEAAEMAAAAGKEVILHQPMQALGGNNLGPGGIYLDTKEEDIRATIAKNLDEIPQAVGMNNHMGSAVTRDEKTMRVVLDIAKSRGIYYLDSLTAPDTATASLCHELSIPYWERDVFLDNKGDKESISAAIEEGKKVASARGAAVLIGHVWSAELAQTLMDIYSGLVEEGYSLSTISRYMIAQSKAGEKENVRPGD